MLKSLAKLAKLFRARWRWVWGYCPRCKRNLQAAFPNHMANDPNCPVCKEEKETKLRVWHNYKTMNVTCRPRVVEVTRALDGDLPGQPLYERELAQSKDR